MILSLNLYSKDELTFSQDPKLEMQGSQFYVEAIQR